jgi:hypothetical protein
MRGHHFVTPVLYSLPTGKGQAFANHGVGEVILGGWQIGSIWSVASGFPLNVMPSKDQSNTGHGYDRPNAVPGATLDLDSSHRSTDEWFNIDAVAIQPLGSYGNRGRDTAHGPGIFSTDLSALKNFPFTEKRYLQFRFEAFNSIS